MDTRYLRLSSGDPSVLTGSPAGDFTIQLGTATPCEGHCVAYLLEATIPFTWTNITAHDFLLVEADKEKKTRITLTPAYYTSIPTLVAALNHELKKKALGVEFTTSTETMRDSVDCKGNLVSGSFLHILGWPKGEILMDKQQAPRLGDVTRGVRSAFVYIDCIRPTNAGSFSGSATQGDADRDAQAGRRNTLASTDAGRETQFEHANNFSIKGIHQ